MTQVDFYVLQSDNPHIRQTLVCKLCEKAYRLGHNVLIRTESPLQNKVLDDLLWTFRAGSFIPHDINLSASSEMIAPVLVSHQQMPDQFDDIFINLGRDVPENFGRFARIIELVDESDGIKVVARRHYQYYKRQDLKIGTHQLDSC